MVHPPYRNPFYALLIVVGTLFVVTAFAYGFMAFQSLHASPADIARHQGHPLWSWLRAYGTTVVLTELAVLGVLSFAAMGTEGYWKARGARRKLGGARSDDP